MSARVVITDVTARRRDYAAQRGITTRQLGSFTDSLLIISAVALSRGRRDPAQERLA